MYVSSVGGEKGVITGAHPYLFIPLENEGEVIFGSSSEKDWFELPLRKSIDFFENVFWCRLFLSFGREPLSGIPWPIHTIFFL